MGTRRKLKLSPALVTDKNLRHATELIASELITRYFTKLLIRWKRRRINFNCILCHQNLWHLIHGVTRLVFFSINQRQTTSVRQSMFSVRIQSSLFMYKPKSTWESTNVTIIRSVTHPPVNNTVRVISLQEKTKETTSHLF